MEIMTQTNRDGHAGADAKPSAEPERHFPRVLRYLLRRLPPQDAQDVAQEVFLRFLRIQRPEAVRDPETYLITVASHVAAEFQQRKQDRGRLQFDSALLERCMEDRGDAGMRPLEDEIDFDRSITELELPYKHRRALFLKLRDDLPKEEIAKQLGLSVATVSLYLKQALAHCRRAYGKRGD
jgi:RNA polymerase sigma factor (sigma-70 family)